MWSRSQDVLMSCLWQSAQWLGLGLMRLGPAVGLGVKGLVYNPAVNLLHLNSGVTSTYLSDTFLIKADVWTVDCGSDPSCEVIRG